MAQLRVIDRRGVSQPSRVWLRSPLSALVRGRLWFAVILLALGLCVSAQAGLAPRIVLGPAECDGFPCAADLAVMDETGRRVRDVSPDLLSVSLNGASLPWSEKPLGRDRPWFALTAGAARDRRAIVLAFDTSASVPSEGRRQAVRVAQTLVANLSAEDRVMVVTFGGQVAGRGGFTGDKAAVATALAGLESTARGTYLYDAVNDALEVLSTVAGAAPGLVILGDGGDESSASSFADCERRAEEAGVPIAAVIIGDYAAGAARLSALASHSGGASFHLDDAADAEALGRAVLASLAPPRRLVFNHPKLAEGGKFRLQVGLRTPAGVVVGAARLLETPGTGPTQSWSSRLGLWLALPLFAGVAVLGRVVLRRRSRPKPPPVHEAFLALKSEAKQLAELGKTLRDTADSFYPRLESYGFAATEETSEWQRAHLGALEQFVHMLQNVLGLKQMSLGEAELRPMIDAIGNGLESALLVVGVQRIEPPVGSAADPEQHELENGAAAKAGERIAEVIRPGFTLRRHFGDRKVEHVFRRAVVRVSENGPAGDAPGREKGGRD